MNQQQAVKLLRSGEKGISDWNKRYDNGDRIPKLRNVNLANVSLCGANLRSVNFTNADLHNSDLRNTNLRDAKFNDANLQGINLANVDLYSVKFHHSDLRHANLSGSKGGHFINADLRNANLSNCDFSWYGLENSNLKGADLRGAKLGSAQSLHNSNIRFALLEGVDFSGADLSHFNLNGANLQGANLRDCDFTESDLSKANLSNSDLSRARFIRTNLDRTIIENALVKDVHILDLKALPNPPDILRLDPNGNIILSGDEANNYFSLPATVEVYITKKLSQQELACMNLHIGDIYRQYGEIDIYFVGHRYEHEGSVIRFQGKSYASLYRYLPDILTPFLFSKAIDWKETLSLIPETELNEVMYFINRKAITTKGKWYFADKMTEIFDGYRNSKIYRIKEGRSRGILINMTTNKDIENRLFEMALPDVWDRKQTLLITAGDNANIQIGEKNVVNKTIVDGDIIGSAVGINSTIKAHDIKSYKDSFENMHHLDSDLRIKLKEACDIATDLKLSQENINDLVIDLKNVVIEFSKEKPEVGRLKRLLENIKQIAPMVSAVLKTAESIKKFLERN